MLVFSAGLGASAAVAQEPISAIDWLDTRGGLAALPGAQPTGLPAPGVNEPPVAQSIQTPEITTQSLDAPQVGAVGLLPRSVTGLPADIWQASSARSLGRRLAQLDVDRLPAMQSLLYTLLLAEAEPPQDSAGETPFLLARIDKLQEFGAVEPALALIERAGPTTSAELFSRWFDLSLLAGEEHTTCTSMRDNPTLAPSQSALIFCRARQGDYETALLTFQNATALGLLPAAEETLLRLYLDEELAEDTPPLPPPSQITPLAFRLTESIGLPLPSSGLPNAYAMADLRGISGWRSEIEAAERLARTGALPENRLLGIYTARRPAASGGLWDRVSAVQSLDRALTEADSKAVSDALPPAWAAIRQAELELPFARLWGAQLAAMDLSGAPANAAFEMALLGPDYETLAREMSPQTARDKFVVAIASGTPDEARAPSATAEAVQRGFASDTEVPATLRLRVAQGQLGEAILEAMSYYARGAEGATKEIAPALSTLRAVGLEDTARRAAIQLLLLERRL